MTGPHLGGRGDLGELPTRLARLGVAAIGPLAGGASSLTYRGVRNGCPVVVKVAPPGLPPVRHRDVLRQARILRALAPTAVPVPEVLLTDPGSPPEVPPLFVMTLMPGESIEPLFDLDGPARGSDAPDGPTMGARMSAAAGVMADLHRIDLGAGGLDLGAGGLDMGEEPVVDSDAEIERWCQLLRTVDATLVPGWEDLAAALRRTGPPAMGPALVHGDFRLGNLLAAGECITAVVDWEIWTVGDPRVDAGWFLANADPATYGRPTRYATPGMLPSVEALAADYAATLGRAVAELGWFIALARFKSAATWSLIVKHNRRRPTPDADVEAMAPLLPRLLDQARKEVS